MTPVAVVGLGRIGAGYPDQPGRPPRTHVGAVLSTPGLRLAALVDPDPKARAAARARFALGAEVVEAETPSDLPRGLAPFMVIAAPPATREETIAAALAHGARLIFVEKPLAASLTTAQSLAARAARAGTALRVNFQRRFDAGHARARTRFAVRPRAVFVAYGNGLWNYGSHAVDFLLDWLGPAARVRAEGGMGPGPDPSVGFRLRFADGLDAVCTGVDDMAWDVFDIALLYADGRLELGAGGAERRVWRPVADRHYVGYTHLALDADASETSPVGGLLEFYAAARDHLAGGAPLKGCDAPAAIAGMTILDAVARSARGAGEWLPV